MYEIGENDNKVRQEIPFTKDAQTLGGARAITKAPNGQFYLLTFQGLLTWNGKNDSVQCVTEPTIKESIKGGLALYATKQGLLIGSVRGLWLWDYKGGLKRVNASNNNTVFVIRRLNDSIVFVGYSTGY